MNEVPVCFRDKSQYLEWMHYAKLSREVVSVCSDCSSEYRDSMILQKRCDRKFWSEKILNAKGKNAGEVEALL